MAIFEFATVIVSTINGTEQITQRDYRFELIKSAKTLEEKISIAKHESVIRLNGKLQYRDGKIFYEEHEIPDRILGASYCNYGNSKKLAAYVNGYIEHLKSGPTSSGEMWKNNLEASYPFVDDGTIFVGRKVSHYDFKERFWPNMSTGVQKHLLKSFRAYKVIPAVYAIGIFGSEWNPNQQMAMIDIVQGSHWCDTDKMLVVLENMVEHKKLIEDWFELSKPSRWNKMVEQDKMWWDHLVEMVTSIDEILKLNPGYIIPRSYPFDELQSMLNRIKHILKGSVASYAEFYNKYNFFDTMAIDEYTVQIPKDSFDLVDNGAKMNICVGQDRYVNGMAKGTKFIIFLWKDGKPAICVEKYLKGEKDEHDGGEDRYANNRDGFQIMYKGNITVVGPLREKIKKFVNGLHNADKEVLMTLVTPEFVAERLKWLEHTVGKKMFKELQKAYMPEQKVIKEPLLAQQALALTGTPNGIRL
jgi:hypothetical protein